MNHWNTFAFCIHGWREFATCFGLLVVCTFPVHATKSEPAQSVTYAWAASMAQDERGQYPISLLKLALSKSGVAYEAKPSKHDMPQWRTLRHVQMGKELDVVWTFTSPERERDLLPIRIPIDRGLLGWRLLLVNRSDSDYFARLESADQLKALRSGQGHDWPDFPILQANGFNVTSSSSYQGLFAMLERGRIRYFPRSMTEIQAEVDAHQKQAFAIAPRWVIYYPAPLYFFVKKDNYALAQAIERGLTIAMKDGSMRQLFVRHFGNMIKQAQLDKREVITIRNPQLSEQTPLLKTELWFSPVLGF
ncbi:substrate-binding periplasmic protein [Undibacterium macrobrachii]|jgi:hypothetical protein|nr:transporter substrate-binding domain-containing protein [Undibacterium macrobrachii]